MGPAPILDLSDDQGGEKQTSVSKKIQGFLPFVLWRCCVMLIGTNLPVGRLFGRILGRHNVGQSVVDAYSAPFPSRLFKAGAARCLFWFPCGKMTLSVPTWRLPGTA